MLAKVPASQARPEIDATGAAMRSRMVVAEGSGAILRASCLIEITVGWSVVLVLSGLYLWRPPRTARRRSDPAGDTQDAWILARPSRGDQALGEPKDFFLARPECPGRKSGADMSNNGRRRQAKLSKIV